MEIEIAGLINWIKNNIFNFPYIIQFIALLFAGIFSVFLSRLFQQSDAFAGIKKFLKYLRFISRDNILRLLNKIIWPLFTIFLIWFYVLIASSQGFPYQIVLAVGHLLNAWVIIKILSSFINHKLIARFISLCIWIIAALKIVGLFEKTVTVLDNFSFSSGNFNISLLTIIKGSILFIFLYFISDKLAEFLEEKIKKVESLSPSARVLIKKFSRIVLILIVSIITLSSLGLDLTTFAFLGGTIGLGIGFGLQKVVSNFVSGIIILVDRSVKPGDVIEINQNYGYIKSLGTRFVSLVTRGGKEFLIPNEDFITQTVVNWSYSDKFVRIDVPVSISYDSDVREVINLIEDSVKKIERIINQPEPKCILTEFGDSAINLNLRFWIGDPNNGIANVKSEALLTIWDVLKTNNIEIPYPQRDLHVKTSEQVSTEL
ncbi:MAG: mechanosensitive ion channel family protein [Halanaerobiaceae bacterium]